VIIFVGEVTNPPGLEPRLALTGESGKHLARLAGVPFPAILRYRRMNVDETGTADQATRREAARRIEESATPGDAIVMLGLAAQKAFGFGRDLTPFSRAINSMGVTLIAFPHPSGRNRYWNDPGAETEASVHLQAIIEEFGTKGDTDERSTD
jgi:hypothetical protein